MQRNDRNEGWAQRQNQEAYDVGPDYWAEHFKISKARIELFHAGHNSFLTKMAADTYMLTQTQADWFRHANHPLTQWWRTSEDFQYVTNTFSVMDLEERSELLLCIAAYMRYFRIGSKDGTNFPRTALLNHDGITPIPSQWDAITIQDMCYFFSQITHPFGLNTNRREGPSHVKGIGQITKHNSADTNSRGARLRVNLHPNSRRNLKWYVETLSRSVFRLIKIEWEAGQTPLNQQNTKFLLRHPGTQLQPKTCMDLILSLFGGEGSRDMGGFPTYIQKLRVGGTNYNPNNDNENADDKIFWHNQNVAPLKQILNSHNGGSKRRKKKRKTKRKTKRKNRKKGTKRRKKKNRKTRRKTKRTRKK